nr:unnamed protein product [Callosobruchus chinensis]
MQMILKSSFPSLSTILWKRIGC